MSGLSSLIAYDEDDDEGTPLPAPAPRQPSTPAAAGLQSHHAIPVSGATSSSSSSSSRPAAFDASSSTPSPSSERLVSVLAPVFAKLPPLSSPPPAAHVSAFLSAFPAHIAPLLRKKEALALSSSSSTSAAAPSLLSQLTSLPSYHNPYILERIIDRLHVDEHASLLPDSRSPAADSLQSITEQAEAEQRTALEREEEEEKQRLSQQEAKRLAAVASVEQLRGKVAAALPAAASASTSAGDELGGKRAEAMRRVAAINARLQQQQQRQYP